MTNESFINHNFRLINCTLNKVVHFARKVHEKRRARNMTSIQLKFTGTKERQYKVQKFHTSRRRSS